VDRCVEKVSIWAVKQGFSKVEQSFERMPTPAQMIEIVAAALPSKDGWRREYRDGVDADGVPCRFFRDENGRDVPHYTAPNCEEGRKTLEQLREIRGTGKRRVRQLKQKSPATVMTGWMQARGQRQVAI